MILSFHSVWVFGVLLCHSLWAGEPSSQWVDRFEAGRGKTVFEWGWTGGNPELQPPDHFFLTQVNTFLRSSYVPKKDRPANALRKEIEWDTQEYPYLRWRWRVQKFPIKGRILDSSRSDAGAQVYLLWKSFPKYYVIKYFWASADPVGTLLEQSKLFVGALRGLVIRSGGRTNVWHTEIRNVHADFRKFFEGDPPGKVKGIAILSDGDETEGYSEADYDDIELLKSPPQEQGPPAPKAHPRTGAPKR